MDPQSLQQQSPMDQSNAVHSVNAVQQEVAPVRPVSNEPVAPSVPIQMESHPPIQRHVDPVDDSDPVSLQQTEQTEALHAPQSTMDPNQQSKPTELETADPMDPQSDSMGIPTDLPTTSPMTVVTAPHEVAPQNESNPMNPGSTAITAMESMDTVNNTNLNNPNVPMQSQPIQENQQIESVPVHYQQSQEQQPNEVQQQQIQQQIQHQIEQQEQPQEEQQGVDQVIPNPTDPQLAQTIDSVEEQIHQNAAPMDVVMNENQSMDQSLEQTLEQNVEHTLEQSEEKMQNEIPQNQQHSEMDITAPDTADTVMSGNQPEAASVEEDTAMMDTTENTNQIHDVHPENGQSEPMEPMDKGQDVGDQADQQMAEPMDTDEMDPEAVGPEAAKQETDESQQMAENENVSHHSTENEQADKQQNAMEMDQPEQAQHQEADAVKQQEPESKPQSDPEPEPEAEPQPEPELEPEPEVAAETATTTTTMSVKPETTASHQQSNVLPELLECGKLLREFMKRPETEPFNEPVDWKGLNLPDYPLIIKHQMDLGTVRDHLEVGKYASADKFAEDIRLVFKNAMTYNTPGSGIYVVAENLFKQFERRFARITKIAPYKRRKNNNVERVGGEQSTFDQRQQFTTMIQQLTPPELGGVVELIDKKSPQALNDYNGNEDELDIEVYNIDGETLKELIMFIEKTINKRAKKKKRAIY